jgi:hypothetical protein
VGDRNGRQENEGELQRFQPVDNTPESGVFFARFDQSLPLQRSQSAHPPVAVPFRKEMSGKLSENGMTGRRYPAA